MKTQTILYALMILLSAIIFYNLGKSEPTSVEYAQCERTVLQCLNICEGKGRPCYEDCKQM